MLGAVDDAADAGYRVLGVSGGEPLLYAGLTEVLRRAHLLGLTTTVTTNGMLLTQRRIDALLGLVDVLAISLDGMPERHVWMRRDGGAFAKMAARLPALRDSGIPFGFVFTLTMSNVHELDWIAAFAADAGASLLQVHPLELEGYARTNMPGDVPDVVELGYAAVEAARLRASGQLFIQYDILPRTALVEHADRLLASREAAGNASWLSPIVLEADGEVVPVTYGFNRRYSLGNILQGRLRSMLAQWCPKDFLQLVRETSDDMAADERQALVNWYGSLAHHSHEAVRP